MLPDEEIAAAAAQRTPEPRGSVRRAGGRRPTPAAAPTTSPSVVARFDSAAESRWSEVVARHQPQAERVARRERHVLAALEVAGGLVGRGPGAGGAGAGRRRGGGRGLARQAGDGGELGRLVAAVEQVLEGQRQLERAPAVGGEQIQQRGGLGLSETRPRWRAARRCAGRAGRRAAAGVVGAEARPRWSAAGASATALAVAGVLAELRVGPGDVQVGEQPGPQLQPRLHLDAQAARGARRPRWSPRRPPRRSRCRCPGPTAPPPAPAVDPAGGCATPSS